nr:retrotransposon protein, putative, unclassified [Tanacetum cinerariifolium]
MDVEQAFWLRISNPTSKPSNASSVIIEAPKELPKIILVNESLKSLNFTLPNLTMWKIHLEYLKNTQEQADILRGIVKQVKVKQPLDNALDFAFLVAAAPRAADLADSSVSTSIDQDAPSSNKVFLIKLKWIYKVKTDEFCGVLKNKARLVAQGFMQDDGINFDESFAPVARIEAIRIFVANSTHKNMTIFQMDVKTTFLNRDSKKRSTFLNQKDLLIRITHRMCTSSRRPSMVSNKHHVHEKSKLDKDLQGTQIDAKLYRSMIGSLMYLISSRPDLIHADTDMSLTAYADADHPRCQDTRRSTSGSAQFLDYGFQPNKIPLYYDNKRAIALCCNNVQHSRAKNIDVCYHFIKEQVENRIVKLYFYWTEYQLADIFTKPLSRERFNFLIENGNVKNSGGGNRRVMM